MLLQSFVQHSVAQLLIVGKDSSSKRGYTYHLFVLPNDPEKAKWDGLPIGAEGAIKSYLADEVSILFPNTDIRRSQIRVSPQNYRPSFSAQTTSTSPSPQR
jgi:hypothetical protein